ncbi:MAG: RNA-binding protein [Planctomycetia bacterium 21-64-5]|nr:MAG: RNA-binding protein [Planctomycetia bacterium 21-64-5]HQU42568.1 CRTAC1 family protein [Pirellulales bacterium]
MTDKCNVTDPQSDDELERDDAVIGRAFRWSLVVIVLAVATGAGAYYYWTRKPVPVATAEKELVVAHVRKSAAVAIPQVHFSDITSESGIAFVHVNGAYGDKLLPETMGGGCAFFDYDNDGDPDLLLINSTYWPGHESAGAASPTSALYRSDGRGHFDDVTAESGLGVNLYGMGVAVGDYDNDGWVDVFLSAVGPNRLFHNEQGTFREVTGQAGVAGEGDSWSTSCGWFDFDNDGDLDLFVANYVRWSKEIDLGLNCTLKGEGRAYCRPDVFEGSFPYLYRNDGQGKFSDVSSASGVQVTNKDTGVPLAKSLGVAPVDLDGDGWIDLVVANDTVQNLVFHNQRNGTFREVGAIAGVAFDPDGKARGAMGIDCACFRNSRTLGIAIGNFSNEPTALYVTQGEVVPSEMPMFIDEAVATGLGPPSRLNLKFGLFFFDYDLDRRLDVFTANGHLEEDIQKVQQSQHYEQPPHLFWNCGSEADSEFMLVPEGNSGDDFSRPLVGRGAAYADIDGDGDLDVLITAIGSPPRLLRNDQSLAHHWLRVKLHGTRANHDAIGAWIEAEVAGETLVRPVMPTRSYLSQVELPVTIGLGAATKVERLTVRWPDGTRQEVPGVEVDRVIEVEQDTSVALMKSR